MFSEQIHRFFFLLGTAVIAVSLPLSPFLLSMGQFILATNWLLEFRFIEKYKLFYKRPSILLLLSIFIIHVIWLLNTNNIEYALHDIKIKLPLLALPIIYGTSKELNKKEFQYILHLFLAAVFVATLISSAIYLGLGKTNVVDNRNISIFISHIRFALMVDLTCFIVIAAMLYSKDFLLFPIYFYFVLAVWLLVYLVFMGAFSGIVVFLLTFHCIFYYWFKRQEKPNLKKVGVLISLITTLLIIAYSGFSLMRFLSKTETDISRLPTKTLNGNPYSHNINIQSYENGNPIWLLISNKELKEQWDSKSNIKLGSKDKKDQWIKTTLIRYLTSLNYTKDSLGISKLSEEDIVMIENGYTNYIFKNKWALYPRIYEILWEVESYIKLGNPSGHSVIQRLELAKNGLGVIRRFFWLGTGTGDVNDEVLHQYELDNSVLESKWQFRPHNQYISFFIAFGCIGFCLLITLVTLGILKERRNIDFIFIAFICIVLFSMISEDTLETQAGASFFAYFLSLFLLGRKAHQKF